jgi:cysteine desulfurase
MDLIYLDYAATTPVDNRVIDIMQPYFNQSFGNPSSIHRYGQRAEAVLDQARMGIAEVINAQPNEIIFTSSGTESDNLALRGVALAAQIAGKGNHMIISPIEHPAVSKTAEELADYHQIDLSYLPVDKYGIVSAADVSSEIRENTILVSVMAANNEIGTINPIKEIGMVCRENNVLFHTDAVQYAAHFDIDVVDLHVDLVSLGAHKFYGPKGVGALFVRHDTGLHPILTGGSQEFGLRAATQNTPLIAGMAKAIQLIKEEGSSRTEHVLALRDLLIKKVLNSIPNSKLSGHPVHRLPNHASFIFKGVDGNLLIQLLDIAGFACSSGSACKTGDPKPSSVLTELGFDPEWSLGSLRVTLGKDTTQQDVISFIDTLPGCLKKSRG